MSGARRWWTLNAPLLAAIALALALLAAAYAVHSNPAAAFVGAFIPPLLAIGLTARARRRHDARLAAHRAKIDAAYRQDYR